MIMSEEYIGIGDDKFVRLDQWQGTFSISMHREYNGKKYWQGVRVITGKVNVSDKTSPQKANLGTRQVAIHVLSEFLKELMHGGQEDPQGPPPASKVQAPPPEPDDIPF
jgi:hypothetical protein